MIGDVPVFTHFKRMKNTKCKSGYGRIDKKWIENLELAEVVDEIAVDLCRGSTMSKYGEYTADDWAEKYIRMHNRGKN